MLESVSKRRRSRLAVIVPRSAVDPERMLSIVDNDELASVAADVKGRLRTVVERAATT